MVGGGVVLEEMGGRRSSVSQISDSLIANAANSWTLGCRNSQLRRLELFGDGNIIIGAPYREMERCGKKGRGGLWSGEEEEVCGRFGGCWIRYE